MISRRRKPKSSHIFRLSLEQRIGCVIVGWKAAADYRKSVGEIVEARILRQCAETLEYEFNAAQKTEKSK